MELSNKNELLSKYYNQIDDLQRDMKAKSKEYKSLLNRLKDIAMQRFNKTPCDDLRGDDECNFNEGEIEMHINMILKEIDCQKMRYINRIEEMECLLKKISDEKSCIIAEKSEMAQMLEEFRSENYNMKSELARVQHLCSENEELASRLDQVKAERDQLLNKVNCLHQNIQELDSSFKETRWALTAEVAEKHDQIQELRRNIACLEEQVRQADMKTLFKDDVIREMRKELKNSKTAAKYSSWDASDVASRKSQQNADKRSSFVTSPSVSSCEDSAMFSAQSSLENLNEGVGEECNDGETTPQEKLESLRKALKRKMHQMQVQDSTISKLECQLKKAKNDLTCLRESYDEKNQFRRFLDLANYEAKLNKFREKLMCKVFNLEKSLKGMSSCQTCCECTCKDLIYEEGADLQALKKYLASLQLKKCTVDPQSSTKECDLGKQLTTNDVDKFRVQAVTAVVALEEMKEQIDFLHELIKKYFRELPCEKGQIEECESKFFKYRDNFDGITDNMCTMLESLNLTQADDSECANKSKTMQKISDDLCRMEESKNQLQKEIRDQQDCLGKVRISVEEAECELKQKKCQLNEQEKEIKSKEDEIGRLREGIKGFRERLRDMQIDIAANLNDEEKKVPSSGSVSVLSDELQELCLILESSQTSIPSYIEKCKEQNVQLQDKLNCLEKCLRNKDETLAFLRQSIKLKDEQLEEKNSRLQASEEDLNRLKKELKEKSRLMCNLQESMKKAKDVEIKIKDDNIEELQFELCELEHNLKSMAEEVVKKEKELDLLQDEILYVSSKNFFLNREMDLMEPKLSKLQKTLVLYEQMVCELQVELKKRECEIEHLYDKVRSLEQELDTEMKNCEQKSCEDAKYINELNLTIRNLQNELQQSTTFTKRGHTDESPCSPKSQENEKKPDPKNTVCQLKNEIKMLKQRLKQAEKNEEINSKLENVIKQGENRQQMYIDKINELQKKLEDTISSHECEKNKLRQSLLKEEQENVKSKQVISKLNETVKCKNLVENKLMEQVDALTSQNECLKREMTADNYVDDFQEEKSNLKVRYCTLKSDIEKEEKKKKALEMRINTLNNVLAKKTCQFYELSQNYKCTSAKAQEAYAKLKDAEDRLKSIKFEMSSRKEYSEDNEEDHVNVLQCLQESLEAKTTECRDLMSEVQCLQVKIKTMEGEFISSQANKDCEVTLLNKEITRLESELDIVEKENWKLQTDLRKLQEELRCKSTSNDSIKADMDKKNKELHKIISEKSSLLESVDGLHKRLEDMCMDNTKKEKENKELRDECARLKKKLVDMENELQETRCDFDALKNQYTETVEKLRNSDKKMENLKKLYCKINQENAYLQESKTTMEKELSEMRAENFMLKEKMHCAKKQKELECKKMKSETSHSAEERSKYCAKIQELNKKVENLECNIIPQLKDEIIRKNNYLDSYKKELQDANESSKKMRDESLRVIQCTKKYLAAQKLANDGLRMRDNRHACNETRDLEEQLKSVSRLNERLYFELQTERSGYRDTEPRSFSPLPWGCPNVERDGSSPDYGAESGFQSMQSSPTSMPDYCGEMKRASSQWNSNIRRHMDNNEFTSCRNNSVR